MIGMTVSTLCRKRKTISKNCTFGVPFLLYAELVRLLFKLTIERKRIMKELTERIKKNGRVLGDGVLKVDEFVTHQVDPILMEATGKRFAEVFADQKITKVVTIEASGIAPAVYAAQALGVPMIFARKSKSLTMDEELLTSSVYSFTKQLTSTISISRKFLSSEDRVLLIDDFLANGQAAKGLIELCRQAGAEVAGIGILIEKSFQDGRQLLEDMGIPVVSLARIASLHDGKVAFLEEDA